MLKLVVLLSGFCATGGIRKEWIPTTNWMEPKNWAAEEIPCSSSRIIFPFDLGTAVQLAIKTEAQSIVLPADGALLLPKTGQLTLGNGPTARCPNSAARFDVELQSWLDPGNWKPLDRTPNKAVPHTEMVPCAEDDVSFPQNATFYIRYPEEVVKIRSISIDGRNLSQNGLDDFLTSGALSLQFRNYDFQTRLSFLQVEKSDCKLRSGCLCQRRDFHSHLVCSNMRKECQEPRCINPVLPVGHCCPICGAFQIFRFDPKRFSLDEFRYEIGLKIDDLDRDLDWFASKVLHNGIEVIQLVLIEKGLYQEDSIAAAADLHEIIGKTPKAYNLYDATLFVAGPEYHKGEMFSNAMKVIFFPLLLAVVFFVSIFVAFEIYNVQDKKIWNPLEKIQAMRAFVFSRFDNADTAGVHFSRRSMAESFPDLQRAFDNPFFGEGSSAAPEAKEKSEKVEIVGKEKPSVEEMSFKKLNKKSSPETSDSEV